jgi:hypothetical protein
MSPAAIAFVGGHRKLSSVLRHLEDTLWLVPVIYRQPQQQQQQQQEQTQGTNQQTKQPLQKELPCHSAHEPPAF